MPRGLKVFRTAIGFHDAYVAAPSQKAALEAWGTDKNLFARGAAEIVTDPALTAEPLANPGQVIRVLRGSAAEHLKALGPTAKPKAQEKAKPAPRPAKAKPAPRPPKPTRDEVRFAEAALAGAEQRRRQRLAEIAEQEKALAAERARAEREHAAEVARFQKRLRAAEERYETELAAWQRS